MIAAIGAKTRALGKNNDLLWRISDDLKRFKKITLGHPVIMGSKTYESIGRLLPKRTNIVLSHDPAYQVLGAIVVHSLQDALAQAKKESPDEIFIIGGGQVFASALPFTDKLYLTLVEDDALGDVYFPDYSKFNKRVFEEKHPKETPPYTYVELERG
ncbi:MAG: dihydrofolate reductase [Parcubacteria group bacterium Gr01-1014_48]|nr:MAG: dihydrofolate reductase [Parcubacteria group bacterium Greene0416_14]TSC73528.1 MAG: dihydrofolate reductase [Parcubacteria group bacterium Gr01-1014_48]TSD00093.1 MAG: dihydrofolate reductase [Parcubacteria group bacterium Greene1014_15]